MQILQHQPHRQRPPQEPLPLLLHPRPQAQPLFQKLQQSQPRPLPPPRLLQVSQVHQVPLRNLLE